MHVIGRRKVEWRSCATAIDQEKSPTDGGRHRSPSVDQSATLREPEMRGSSAGHRSEHPSCTGTGPPVSRRPATSNGTASNVEPRRYTRCPVTDVTRVASSFHQDHALARLQRCTTIWALSERSSVDCAALLNVKRIASPPGAVADSAPVRRPPPSPRFPTNRRSTTLEGFRPPLRQ